MEPDGDIFITFIYTNTPLHARHSHLRQEHAKPDINESTYFEWIKKAIVPALKSDGIIEVRTYRNIKVSRGVLVVGVWKTLAL